jgi:signal peptidase II
LLHRRSRDLLVLGIAVIVVAADQISKAWVHRSLVLGVPWDPVPWLRPILSLTYVTNTGAAFGMLPQLAALYPLIAVTVLVALFFFFRGLATSGLPTAIGLGLLLGGTVGNNIIDRLWHGYVTDFVDLNFWPLREWPVFNVADSSIVVGVCILTVYLLLQKEQPAPASVRREVSPSTGRESGGAGHNAESDGDAAAAP